MLNIQSWELCKHHIERTTPNYGNIGCHRFQIRETKFLMFFFRRVQLQFKVASIFIVNLYDRSKNQNWTNPLTIFHYLQFRIRLCNHCLKWSLHNIYRYIYYRTIQVSWDHSNLTYAPKLLSLLHVITVKELHCNMIKTNKAPKTPCQIPDKFCNNSL